MRQQSKNSRKLRNLKKSRNRLRVDQVNTAFSRYFTDIDHLKASLSKVTSPDWSCPAIFESGSYSRHAACKIFDSTAFSEIWNPGIKAVIRYDQDDVFPLNEISHRIQVVTEAHSPLLLFESYKASVS